MDPETSYSVQKVKIVESYFAISKVFTRQQIRIDFQKEMLQVD